MTILPLGKLIDLLNDTGLLGYKGAETPTEPNHKLGEALEDDMVDKGSYQRMIG